MQIEQQIDGLERSAWLELVRQVVGSETAEPGPWRVQPITTGRGWASSGVYRITGSAHDRGVEVAWSLILKVVALEASDWNPASSEVDHPLYWKREVFVYQSELLHNLPGGIEAPRCYSTTQRPGNVIWLWLEDVRDSYAARWPLDQYMRAAQALGQFNGAYLAGRPLPPYPWLGLPGATSGLIEFFAPLQELISDPTTWAQPVMRRAFPVPVAERLESLWADWRVLIAGLDRLPHTLCHKDAHRSNMFAPRRPDGGHRLVMIDWASPGIGELGIDAGDLFAASWHTFGVDHQDIYAFDRAVFDAYLQGLQDAGWHADPRLARFGYAAYAALKYGALLLWLPHVGDEERFVTLEQRFGQPRDAFLAHHAQLVYCLLDLADEARTILNTTAI